MQIDDPTLDERPAVTGTDGDSADYLAVCGWLTRPRPDSGIRIPDEEDGWSHRGYGDLAADARGIAAHLMASGLRAGDGACLVLPTDFRCVATLFAAWSAGAVVTLVPPPVFGGGEEYIDHLAAIIAAAAPRLVVTAPELESVISRGMTAAGVPGAPVLVRGTERAEQAPRRTAITGNDCALVQFTSGSSGKPKGVRISWTNLAANLDHIHRSLAWEPTDATASWLPLYHDMGLIGGLLATISLQGDLYLMRPDEFIRDPRLWIEAMARVEHSVAPSFGLGYAARRLDHEQIADLDLSGFRSLIVGAEPIDVEHVHAFTELLTGIGYDPACLRPAYGSAESTLMSTMSEAGHTPTALRIDRTTLRFGGRVTIREHVDYLGQRLGAGSWVVGLGGSTSRVKVRIVDGEGAELPAGTLGEVVVAGTSVAGGYHDQDQARPDAAAGTRFAGGELFTADAGFIQGGELYILGRMGSSIKVRGKSVFMEDVDVRVAREAGLAGHRVAAVAMQDAGAAAGIVLFAETEPGEWIEAARKALRAELGPAAKVTIAVGGRGLIRRTSSGKPRRRLMWEMYGKGELDTEITVYEAAEPIAPRPARVIADRRPSSAVLSDTEIAELLDRALTQVRVADEATILLEGSIAEGFGNEGSDIDFLVVSPGAEQTPEMPTVLFLGGRRVEVRTRSREQLRGQLDYAAMALTNAAAKALTEETAAPGLLDLDQDILNRCQRFTRAVIVRPGAVDIDELRRALPQADLSRLLSRWWYARARESLRQAVAMSALRQREESADWARDGLLQAVKGWAAGRGETYLESKWIGPQLERIGDQSVAEKYFEQSRGLLLGTADLAGTLALASELGIAVDDDPAAVLLGRVKGVTSWPIDGRVHVLRDSTEVFVLSDRAARAWRTVVFGRSLPEIERRLPGPLHDELAEFVRLGLVALHWGRRNPIRPAVAMVKPQTPYIPPPVTVAPSLGIGGGARADDRAVSLNPLPARRFTECGSALVWSNVIIENAREDLLGALAQRQHRVADAAADRLIKGAVRLLLGALGVSPLPPDVAATTTLDRLMPAATPRRTELLAQLRAARAVA
ncbi:MAG: AMP-binding protein, partial [Nocardia sp.]|nr:AMP-binding protein [Nocardia sp.]